MIVSILHTRAKSLTQTAFFSHENTDAHKRTVPLLPVGMISLSFPPQVDFYSFDVHSRVLIVPLTETLLMLHATVKHIFVILFYIQRLDGEQQTC